MRFLILIPFMFTGCAAPSTSILYHATEGKVFHVEMDKEYKATNLYISINPETGLVTITADSWESLSASVINAQAKRDKVGAQVFDKSIETAIKAAIKAAVPVP